MNKNYLILLIIPVLSLFSCQDKIVETFTANSPIYLSYDDLRISVKKVESHNLRKPGKIYFKDNLIFINENMEGVHIYDVSNPATPLNKGFITIPGNVDIAIRDNTLYADNYIDMVALDISDINNIKEVGRVRDVFPYLVPEYNKDYPLAKVDKTKGVVIGWEIEKVRQDVENRVYPIYYYKADAMFNQLSSSTASGGGTTLGVGGSMARFGIYKDMLYTVDEGNLFKFNIKSLSTPISLGQQHIGWGIETMFIYNARMFFGTRTGMLVYNLETEQNPTYVNQFSHIRSCDPVVIQNDLAYVTLRGGTVCGSNTNRLNVLKMSADYTKINMIASYSMTGPYGLGIDDELLFVCDGDAGLKVYNAADPLTIDQHKVAQFAGINTYDVIPVNNYLFMIGSDGFYLYDYSNIQNIKQISTIPIVKTNN